MSLSESKFILQVKVKGWKKGDKLLNLVRACFGLHLIYTRPFNPLNTTLYNWY